MPGRFGRGLLASSHAGTRLPIAVYKVQGAPPPPAAVRPRDVSLPFPKEDRGRAASLPAESAPHGGDGPIQPQKNGDTRAVSPKKAYSMTSYGGIIRIRSRVEVERLPLSLLHKLPRFSLSLRNPEILCIIPRSAANGKRIRKKERGRLTIKLYKCIIALKNTFV